MHPLCFNYIYIYIYNDFYVSNCILKAVFCHIQPPPPAARGGIEYLIDLDSYAGWSFYTPVRASQVRQVEG